MYIVQYIELIAGSRRENQLNMDIALGQEDWPRNVHPQIDPYDKTYHHASYNMLRITLSENFLQEMQRKSDCKCNKNLAL